MRRARVTKHRSVWVTDYLISHSNTDPRDRWYLDSFYHIRRSGFHDTWQEAMDAAERWVRP